MKTKAARLLAVLVGFAMAAPSVAPATDVDGGNDCLRTLSDFGDAPENSLAYPGVIGHFPSCLAPSAPGTQEASCPVFGTLPGATGYVHHVTNATVGANFWLGCGPVGAIGMGVDSEADAKVNSTGAPTSHCNDVIPVD